MEVNLVSEALKFLVLGMGTVFVFLILMVISMNILAIVVHKCFPDTPSDTDNMASSAAKSSSKKNKVAAIVAAIMHHNQAK